MGAHVANSTFSSHAPQKAFPRQTLAHPTAVMTCVFSTGFSSCGLHSDSAFLDTLSKDDRVLLGRGISKTIYNFVKNCWGTLFLSTAQSRSFQFHAEQWRPSQKGPWRAGHVGPSSSVRRYLHATQERRGLV